MRRQYSEQFSRNLSLDILSLSHVRLLPTHCWGRKYPWKCGSNTKNQAQINKYLIHIRISKYQVAHDHHHHLHHHHHHFDHSRRWCLPKLYSLIMSRVIMLTSHLKTSRCFAQIWPQRALGHPSSVGTLSFYQHCHSIRLKYHFCWQMGFLKHIKRIKRFEYR